MAGVTGSAPGRLDVLGGVADYSGALVLEMPTRQSIEVVAEADDALVVGSAVLSVVEMARLAELDYDDVRRALACPDGRTMSSASPSSSSGTGSLRLPAPACVSRPTSPNQWAWRRARRWRWPRRVRSGPG